MDPGIILFDGDCAFCNGWVKWIMRRDPEKRFMFFALASEEGIALRRKHGVPETVDSIVLVKDGQAFTRSDAAWRVLNGLPNYGFLGSLVRLVPRPLRNLGYDLIARNRHRLGMKDTCELPEHRG
jgi:predicted DCC family thiol-disulfide oxidoreductase YuxK